MRKPLDLTNKKFNRLTGIKPTEKRAGNKIIWLFKCECGNECEAVGTEVKSGHTKSCGCWNIERTTQMGKSNKTHGHASGGKLSKTYMIWAGMKRRCLDPKHKRYMDYGGRRITICDRWLNENKGYLNFLDDMGECPLGKSLNRIKNNKGYYSDNCCWSTQEEQCRNKRNNHLITFNGKKLTIAEWSEITGIYKGTILRRINAGWSPEDALTVPPDTRHNWRIKHGNTNV